MKLSELNTILDGAELPYTYYSFPTGNAPALPYFVYYMPSMAPESADNVVHAPVYTVIVELYTEEKDFETESKLESALSSFNYTKEETYLDDEEMYMYIYTFEEVIEWEE